MTRYQPGDLLPEVVLRLVGFICAELTDVGPGVVLQASSARIVRGSATMIDVEVSDSAAPLAISNGPLPVRAIVHDETGDSVGEILVWIRSGKFIGLEQAWFSPDPPTSWPEPERVKFL
jgi:hypothetical protein